MNKKVIKLISLKYLRLILFQYFHKGFVFVVVINFVLTKNKYFDDKSARD